MEAKIEHQKVMQDIVNKVDDLLKVVGLFEESRPTEKSVTKLEEAVMWMNVMCHHVPMKPIHENISEPLPNPDNVDTSK